MARGKYGEKAAKRQAELAVTNDLASYQHRVAKLTAENRELRERLAAQERGARSVERRLRAERDEGVAPQIAALQLALTAEKTRAREHMLRVATVLSEIFDRNDVKINRRDWPELLAVLGVSFGEFAGDRVTQNRNSRRTSASRMRHIAELEQSKRLSGSAGPAPGEFHPLSS